MNEAVVKYRQTSEILQVRFQITAIKRVTRIFWFPSAYKSYVCTIFSMALPAHSGPRPLIQFRNHFSQTVGLLGQEVSPSQASTYTQDNTNTEYTHTDIHASSGIRTHDPNVERAKTIHALDGAATVIGKFTLCCSLLRVQKH
jgi:hypothetical protein